MERRFGGPAELEEEGKPDERLDPDEEGRERFEQPAAPASAGPVAEHAQDAISEITADGRLVYVNPRFTELFGWRPEDVVGTEGLALVHPEDRESVEAVRLEAMGAESTAQLVFRYRCKDGGWRWVELNGRPYRTEGGELRAVLVSRDVTARVAGVRALGEQLAAERRIDALARRFLALHVDDLADGILQGLETAAEIAGADRCEFFVLAREPGRDPLRYEWCAEGIAPLRPRPFEESVRVFPWAGKQLFLGRPLHIPRVSDLAPEAANERAHFESEGVRSFLSLPVRDEGPAVGFLGFYRMRRDGEWSDQDIARLRLVADVLVSLIRRVRAEKAQLETDVRFRRLAEHARDTLCEMDGDGNFLFVSPNVVNLLGYDREETARLDILSLMHPDDVGKVAEEHRRRKHTGSANRVTYRLRHRHGDWRFIEATAQQYEPTAGEVRVAMVLRDVTERERHRADLERQLEIEKSLSALSRDFLGRATGDFEGAIQHGLEAAARFARADRAFLFASAGRDDEARSFDWHDPAVAPRPPEGALAGPELRKWFARRLALGEVVHTSRSDLPADASVFGTAFERAGIRSFLLIPIHDDGRLVGVLGFHCLREERDWQEHEIALLRITAGLFTSLLRRQRAEDELRESQARLLQSQKMEAVGTLAGGIAHDFNNQLAVMLGNARFVRGALPEDCAQRDAFADLERAAEHCAALTRSLLAFSRRTAASPRPLSVSDALATVRELLVPLIPRSIELVVSATDDVGSVIADPTQLQQVVVNLALNARDAMPRGGHLRIRAARVEVGAREAERRELARDGSYVEISVEDDGTGIDAATSERVFEPFFTTKEPGRGTGLGLATVYGIVRDAGGVIGVESEPGAGSMFRVLLPQSEAVGGEALGDSDVGNAAVASGTVLLVEDEAAVRRTLARILRAAGHEVIEARDGIAALALLEERGWRVDALVSDLEMPRMGGVELATMVARTSGDIGIVLLSGHAPERLAAVPGARFLQKPFADEALLASLADAVGSTSP